MPTPAQIQTLLDLLATRTPVVVIETHEETRVLALFAEVAKRTDREVWSWSVSRGLRVAHGLKLSLLDFGKKEDGSSNANDTKELPQALAQIERLDAAAIVLLLDVHPYLSNPVITRAMKELALKCEKDGRQLVLVGHDLDLPSELSPFSSCFEVEPMTLERVQKVFTAEMSRLRGQTGRDVSGCRETLQSLLAPHGRPARGLGAPHGAPGLE